ncbi:MAG: GTPase Era [Acidimicrobiia bacterium]
MSGAVPEELFRSGFVTLVGRPNAGKSTLLNRLVGQKVSIVSDRPQTTRNQVRGVLNGEGHQIVFIDTPGLHKPRTELGRRCNARSLETFGAVDAVCFVVDATAPVGSGDRFVAARLAEVPTPVVVALNKTDVAPKAAVAAQLTACSALGDFAAYVPVSALTGEGTDTLVGELGAFLAPGPCYYPPDVVTDQADEFLAAEVLREKLLATAREELPHSLAVTVTEFDERDGPEGVLLAIRAVISVERDSQKGMVIGKGGSILRDAGTAARVELEALLGAKVYLETHVKVEPAWQRSPSALDRLGF